MAEFCTKCFPEVWGYPGSDFAGLCKPGQVIYDVCEGCGLGWFDHMGNKIEAEVIDKDSGELIGELQADGISVRVHPDDCQCWKCKDAEPKGLSEFIDIQIDDHLLNK